MYSAYVAFPIFLYPSFSVVCVCVFSEIHDFGNRFFFSEQEFHYDFTSA